MYTLEQSEIIRDQLLTSKYVAKARVTGRTYFMGSSENDIDLVIFPVYERDVLDRVEINKWCKEVVMPDLISIMGIKEEGNETYGYSKTAFSTAELEKGRGVTLTEPYFNNASWLLPDGTPINVFFSYYDSWADADIIAYYKIHKGGYYLDL